MAEPLSLSSKFIFVSCQAGAEKALKREIELKQPALRFAFSRPGFVTFKHAPSGVSPDELGPDFQLDSVFAQAFGLSIGREKDASSILNHAKALSSRFSRPLRLHVWERASALPGDEPLGFVLDQRARAFRQELLDESPPGLFLDGPIAGGDDLVFDVIGVEEEEWWWGAHLHSFSHSPFPGGRAEIPYPAGAPSRAYLKLKEAILVSRAPLSAGDLAVEIGSAPGGASFALLEEGLRVIGIDPAAMDEALLRHARFQHLRKPMSAIERRDLGEEDAQWVLMDVNLAPQIALRGVSRLTSWYKSSLLGVFLTVKLNQWEMVDEIPRFLEQVREMGIEKPIAKQLSLNRREILIYGFTQSGRRKAQIRRRA